MEDCDRDVIRSRVAVAYVTQMRYHILLHLGCDYVMALKKSMLGCIVHQRPFIKYPLLCIREENEYTYTCIHN